MHDLTSHHQQSELKYLQEACMYEKLQCKTNYFMTSVLNMHTWLEAILSNRIVSSGNSLVESELFVNMATAVTHEHGKGFNEDKTLLRLLLLSHPLNLRKNQKHLPTHSNHQMHQQSSVALSHLLFIRLKNVPGSSFQWKLCVLDVKEAKHKSNMAVSSLWWDGVLKQSKERKRQSTAYQTKIMAK